MVVQSANSHTDKLIVKHFSINWRIISWEWQEEGEKKKKALGNTGPYWRCTLAATDTEQKGYEVKLRNVGNVEHKIECCWTQRWCR